MPFTLSVFLAATALLAGADKTSVPGQVSPEEAAKQRWWREHEQQEALAAKERWLREHGQQEELRRINGGIQQRAPFQNPHAEAMRSLFPGPLMFDMGMKGPTPFAEPDPIVLDMMAALSGHAQEAFMPSMHEVTSISQAPFSCQQDVRMHCQSARSQVHCLGQNANDISEACRKDVGASVPFLCHEEISRFCHVLQEGVLGCLRRSQAQLSQNCQDAVQATATALEHINSARVPQPQPPAAQMSPPAQPQRPQAWQAPVPQFSMPPDLSAGHTRPQADMFKKMEQEAQEKFDRDMDRLAQMVKKLAASAHHKKPEQTTSPYLWVHLRVALGLMVVALVAITVSRIDFERLAFAFLGPAGTPLLEKSLEMQKPLEQYSHAAC
eukprot:TRINITY_DN48092_c0_g1_i1.p1 TRINITY_DN48092_c0_g1~~TRINITY_DN48092_c0_g1_i1.p1  ORF type:complete len:382 (+),score=72.84 TRINITY_DN48092_c0_g1_i1:105-1250(+)